MSNEQVVFDRKTVTGLMSSKRGPLETYFRLYLTKPTRPISYFRGGDLVELSDDWFPFSSRSFAIKNFISRDTLRKEIKILENMGLVELKKSEDGLQLIRVLKGASND